MIKGIGISEGIAIGRCKVLKHKKTEIVKNEKSDIKIELKKFEVSRHTIINRCDALYEKTKVEIDEDHAAIFKAHQMMAEDVQMISEVETIINDGINAEYAIKTVSDKYIGLFEAMDNDYMKERALDIKDVFGKIINHMTGDEMTLSDETEPFILCADDLTPSDLVNLNKDLTLGIVTEIGGKTSHTAIIAKTLGLPGIVGVSNLLDHVYENTDIIMNGTTGEIFTRPSEKELKDHQTLREQELKEKAVLSKLIGEKSITLDGYEVELAANIGSHLDIDAATENDCEGVGLFRTEFIYMNAKEFPTEEDQYEIYKAAAENLNGKPLIIRTLDIGGDKHLDYYSFKEEMNPFLGKRAIRLCLDEIEIFKIQLRALLRASHFGNIKIMFPMISSYEELIAAKKILSEVQEDLRQDQISFDEAIKVGMMIEIPSAALIADILAKEVDFFSIGTNDLIQYTTAVDRMNEDLKDLYTPYHPGVLRLINLVIKAANKAGIMVGMCGEAASDPYLVPLLIAMGINELSMSASGILKTRQIVRNLKRTDYLPLVDELLSKPTATAVLERLKMNNI